MSHKSRLAPSDQRYLDRVIELYPERVRDARVRYLNSEIELLEKRVGELKDAFYLNTKEWFIDVIKHFSKPVHKKLNILKAEKDRWENPVYNPDDITDEMIERARQYPTSNLVDKHFINCLFHQEKTPSMKIYKDGYHCFGCGAHGDVIDLYMQVHGVDFKTAVKLMQY